MPKFSRSYTAMHPLVLCGMVAAITLAVGCTPSEEAPVTEDTPATEETVPMGDAPEGEQEAMENADEAARDTGPGNQVAVRGMILWTGPQPQPVRLDTGADPKCAAMHGDEPLYSNMEIVSDEGEVKNVFVYISNPPDGDYTPPSIPVILDQRGCEYTPHVFGVMVGQDLEIRNSDPTLHNVRSSSRINRSFNLGQPEDSLPRVRNFDKPEMEIRFRCDVHPWMNAFAFVMEHPYFAVSDEEGVFEIDSLPPGTYTLHAWHEKYGEQEAEVTVVEGETAEVNFTYSP